MTEAAPGELRENSAPIGVVFDLDGTLIDSRADIVRATNLTRVRAGRPPLPPEVVEGFVGDGAKLLVQRAFDIRTDTKELARLVEIFLEEYSREPVVDTTVIDGVFPTLEALANLPLAICTNKPRQTTVPVLNALGLEKWFRVVVAGGDTPRNKPAPGPLYRVAEELGIEAKRLVMVGDGPQDILAARAVGAHAVGLRGGFLPIERLLEARPDVLLDRIDQLPEYLRQSGFLVG